MPELEQTLNVDNEVEQAPVNYSEIFLLIRHLQNGEGDKNEILKDLTSQYGALERDLDSSSETPGYNPNKIMALEALNLLRQVDSEQPVRGILKRNWDKIAKMASEDSVGKTEYLRAVSHMVAINPVEKMAGGPEYEKELAFSEKIKKEALPHLEELMNRGIYSDEVVKAFVSMHETGGDTEKDLDRILDKNFKPEIVLAILKTLDEFGDLKQERRYGLQTESIFKNYDANIRKHLKIWEDNSNTEKFGDYVFENISRLRELENERPGAGKDLEKKFGIVNFARYPKEILLRQLDEEDKNGEYGIMVYPKTDWNGALHKNRWLPEFYENLSGLEKPVMLRIFEVGSVFELAKQTARLNSKFGKKDKISFGILAGHGNPESIALSNSKEPLHKRDLVGSSAKRFGRFFKEDADVVFLSCSTGKSGGIAEDASSALELNVTGPTGPDSVGRMGVFEGEDGKIRLKAEYGNEKTPPTYSNPRVTKPEIDDFEEMQKARRQLDDIQF